MQKRYFIAAAAIFLGAVLMLLPYYIIPVCSKLIEGKMGMMLHMRCFYTARASLLLGALTVVAGIGFTSKSIFPSGKSLAFWLASLGILVIVLPFYILPICQKSSMNCHKTIFGWIIAGLALIAIGLAGSRVTEEQ